MPQARFAVVGTLALAGSARESALLAMTKFTRICTVENSCKNKFLVLLRFPESDFRAIGERTLFVPKHAQSVEKVSAH